VSGWRPPLDHDSASSLIGAYVLDACDEDETSAIDAHLLRCEACQREVAEIRRAAGWLGMSDSVTPPGWLRAEILRAAEKDTLTRAERRGPVADRRAGDRGEIGGSSKSALD
jgi:anti-sigma factor RsiW